MKNKKNIDSTVLIKVLIVLTVVIAILTSVSFVMYVTGLLDSETSSLLVGVCEVLAALVAGAFIVVQLQRENLSEIDNAKTEEAHFLLELNASFVGNEKLTDLEHCLEYELTHQGKKPYISLINKRQDLINYLVYLEGFASCVHEKSIDVKDIDNLFSYRFFLAMNHPEVQQLEIISYPNYYLGNYQLYKAWFEHRMKDRHYDPYKDVEKCDDTIMPLSDSALIKDVRFERFLSGEDKIEVYKDHDNNEKYTAVFSCNGTNYKAYIGKNRDIKIKPDSLMLEEKERIELKNRLLFVLDKYSKFPAECHGKQLQKGDEVTLEEYDAISQLIYETDSYIYPALFGEGDEGKNNAKMLIPLLLQSGNDQMFNKSNLFLFYHKKEIVGLILWHKGDLRWDASLLMEYAKDNDIKLNVDNVNKVEKGYVDKTYDKQQDENTIDLINICVKDNLRGIGVGEQMMSEFIKNHKEEDMKLCVLVDNNNAVKLYKKNKFAKIGQVEKGFALREKDRPDIYNMRRPKDNE